MFTGSITSVDVVLGLLSLAVPLHRLSPECCGFQFQPPSSCSFMIQETYIFCLQKPAIYNFIETHAWHPLTPLAASTQQYLPINRSNILVSPTPHISANSAS